MLLLHLLLIQIKMQMAMITKMTKLITMMTTMPLLVLQMCHPTNLHCNPLLHIPLVPPTCPKLATACSMPATPSNNTSAKWSIGTISSLSLQANLRKILKRISSGEARLWYETLNLNNIEWLDLQNAFRQQYPN